MFWYIFGKMLLQLLCLSSGETGGDNVVVLGNEGERRVQIGRSGAGKATFPGVADGPRLVVQIATVLAEPRVAVRTLKLR